MNVLSGHVIATTVLFTLSGLWLGLVSKIVPEPYLVRTIQPHPNALELTRTPG